LRALERVSSADRFTSTLALLFLLSGRETRLPSRGLLAWRRSYCLDLLFLGLLGFPISSPLAMSISFGLMMTPSLHAKFHIVA
jgi:hypothetical protein